MTTAVAWETWRRSGHWTRWSSAQLARRNPIARPPDLPIAFPVLRGELTAATAGRGFASPSSAARRPPRGLGGRSGGRGAALL